MDQGADVIDIGIVATPMLGTTVARKKFDGGIMISASHNPFYDNGIKIFKGDGFKLSDEKEAQIEELVLNENLKLETRAIQDIGRVYTMADSGKRYANFLKHTVPGNLYFKGLKIVMDCSNGATFVVAPELLTKLGAEHQ